MMNQISVPRTEFNEQTFVDIMAMLVGYSDVHSEGFCDVALQDLDVTPESLRYHILEAFDRGFMAQSYSFLDGVYSSRYFRLTSRGRMYVARQSGGGCTCGTVVAEPVSQTHSQGVLSVN